MSDPLEQLAHLEENLKARRMALSSMCYRECRPGIWLKPVGIHLFAYSEIKNEWSNWFIVKDGSNALWTAKDLVAGEHFLYELKQLEAYTRINVNPGTDRHLELEPEWKYRLE